MDCGRGDEPEWDPEVVAAVNPSMGLRGWRQLPVEVPGCDCGGACGRKGLDGPGTVDFPELPCGQNVAGGPCDATAFEDGPTRRARSPRSGGRNAPKGRRVRDVIVQRPPDDDGDSSDPFPGERPGGGSYDPGSGGGGGGGGGWAPAPDDDEEEDGVDEDSGWRKRHPTLGRKCPDERRHCERNSKGLCYCDGDCACTPQELVQLPDHVDAVTWAAAGLIAGEAAAGAVVAEIVVAGLVVVVAVSALNELWPDGREPDVCVFSCVGEPMHGGPGGCPNSPYSGEGVHINADKACADAYSNAAYAAIVFDDCQLIAASCIETLLPGGP